MGIGCYLTAMTITPSASPQRIAVVGVTGSGKTTLARELSRRLALPHVELDALYWGPGWMPAPRALFRERVSEALRGPAIARRLTRFFHDLDAAPKLAAPPLAFPELTDREREVLDLIAQGHNNAEIAARLSLSPKTIGNHVSNIFSKLQVADRAQAIVRARQGGLGREARG
jgi:DNA-binding CsgD family transcriptional regulator